MGKMQWVLALYDGGEFAYSVGYDWFGSYFMKKAPKNQLDFGYRTPRSMKNKETWEFAHRYAGRIWFKTGWAVLLIAMAAMLMLLGQDKETLGLIGAIMSLLQCVPLLAVIPITERALRRGLKNECFSIHFKPFL